MNPTSAAWQNLQNEFHQIGSTSLNDLFENDRDRGNKYFTKSKHISLDYSKNHLTAAALQQFSNLADEIDLRGKIAAMFHGEKVNSTEDRAALHTLLRRQQPPSVDNLANNYDEISSTLRQMEIFSDRFASGEWIGWSGKSLDRVVHIGIGGSFLGPRMVCEALKPDQSNNVKISFLANIDGHHVDNLLPELDLERTLVIIVSKSFSTQETLTNAQTLMDAFKQAAGGQDPGNHFVAITANTQAAENFGIPATNQLPLWDYVGGRYSLWSAVGLPIALQYGFGTFSRLLRGAEEMDHHFLHAPWSSNIPVLLAMIGIWYRNFFGTTSHAVLPYDHYLRLLPAHLQQLDMESNGKSTSSQGKALDIGTGPVVWGSEGTNGQHAFHQLLHQGTETIPVDFVLPLQPRHRRLDHHEKLIANCLAQSQALMLGRSRETVLSNQDDPRDNSAKSSLLASHKAMPGNRPSNMLLMDKVTPESIGALIALYEHKVFTQAMVWGINPFDQWGVELGKELAGPILNALRGDPHQELDSSTQHLVQLYQL